MKVIDSSDHVFENGRWDLKGLNVLNYSKKP